MFKLFKRKNKIKELETRILVIESDITKINAQKGINFKKFWTEIPTLSLGNHNEKVNLPCCKCDEEGNFYVKGGLIKDVTISAATANCGNCNKEAVVPLESTEFISKLAKELAKSIEENRKNQTHEVILNIDGIEIAKIAKEEFKGLDNYKISEK